MASAGQPRLTFGVVTDVQYANAEDGWDFHMTRQRLYRNAAVALRRAMEAFAADQAISFVLQLGDVLDGKCKQTAREDWSKVIEPTFRENRFVAGAQEPSLRDVHHLIGNHELYCFARSELHDILGTQRGFYRGEKTHYYSFKPCSGWRFIVLDPFEFSMLNGDEAQYQAAVELCRKTNPNDITSNADWTAGLSGTDRRFCPYNGSVSDNQLAWLREELESAAAVPERCIVLSHIALCPGACAPETLLWNYESVLEILHAQPRGIVVACLYGHDHKGGYVVDSHGIHHRTFEAILETSSDAYAVISCYDDRLEIAGKGDIESATWTFPKIEVA